MTTLVRETELPLPLLHRGKVRDVYEVDTETLLLVATDRVSAFDVVMREPVPFKGAVLTQITAWWFQQLDGITHHMISADVDEIISRVSVLTPMHRAILAGRAMLALRAKVYPVECVVRGYLSGSGWKEYRDHGTLATQPLPPGLLESSRLPQRVFAPATKAESGHDENISKTRAAQILGPAARELERLSLHIYDRGSAIAGSRGLILADTKFEFGERGGTIILIDEVMTPDSSRFWAADTYRPGTTPQASTNSLCATIWRRNGWLDDGTGTHLHQRCQTKSWLRRSARYLDAFHRITGHSLDTAALT